VYMNSGQDWVHAALPPSQETPLVWAWREASPVHTTTPCTHCSCCGLKGSIGGLGTTSYLGHWLQRHGQPPDQGVQGKKTWANLLLSLCETFLPWGCPEIAGEEFKQTEKHGWGRSCQTSADLDPWRFMY
jgi:hypothetical protein